MNSYVIVKMEPLTFLLVCGITIAIGTLVGNTASNLVFSDNKKIESEIKSEIRVMSNEIKGIGMMEVLTISIVIFVVATITGIAITYFVLKKCKKNNKNNLSVEHFSVAQSEQI